MARCKKNLAQSRAQLSAQTTKNRASFRAREQLKFGTAQRCVSFGRRGDGSLMSRFWQRSPRGQAEEGRGEETEGGRHSEAQRREGQ